MNQLIENLSPSEMLGLTLSESVKGLPFEVQVNFACTIRNCFQKNPGSYKNWHDLLVDRFPCWEINSEVYPILLEKAELLITGVKLEDSDDKQCMWIARGIIDWAIKDTVSGAWKL